jgi:hypothetical protein
MDRNISTETPLDSRAITENKNTMQELADIKTLESQVAKMKKDPQANKHELSQLEYKLKQLNEKHAGRDESKQSLIKQCNDYFEMNKKLLDKNQIIAETRARLANGETVNEWPHLAAVFLLESQAITTSTHVALDALRTQIEADKKFFSEMNSYTLDGKTLTFQKFDYESWPKRFALTLSNNQTFYLQKNPNNTWSTVSPTSDTYNITIDATNKTVTIKNKVESAEMTAEKLIKEVQAKLDAYAKTKDYYSIKLIPSGATKNNTISNVTEFEIELNKWIQINDGPRSPWKPEQKWTIGLQTSHLWILKSADELYTEIIRKIEGQPVPPREDPVPAPTPSTTETPAPTTRTRPSSRRESQRETVDIDATNKAFLEKHRSRFEAVGNKLLNASEENKKTLGWTLDAYMEDPSQQNAVALQKSINEKFSKWIGVDKKVGPETLEALESIVGIASPASTEPWGGGGSGGNGETRRPGSNQNRPGRDPNGAYRGDRTEIDQATPSEVRTKMQQNQTPYLNGADLRRAWTTFNSQPLTPEQQKQVEKVQNNLLYLEFAKQYHQIAMEANESKMGFAGLRSSKETAKNYLDVLSKMIIQKSENPAQAGIDTQIILQIRTIDEKVWVLNGLIWATRIKQVEDIINSKKSPDDKYAEMVNILRGGYIDSGTTKAWATLAPGIIEKNKTSNNAIRNISEIIHNNAIKNSIINATTEKEVVKILTDAKVSPSIASDVASTWSDVRKNLQSNRDKLLEDYKKNHPGDAQAASKVDALIREHTYGGAIEEYQRIALKETVKQNPDLRKDRTVEVFAQAEWVDTWSIRDSRKAAVTEAAIALAMTAIPMGAGFVLGGLATKGIVRAAEWWAARAWAGSRIHAFARWAANAEYIAWEGAGRALAWIAGKSIPLAGNAFTFTESFNIMNNLIQKDNIRNWSDGGLNGKETIKNMAFFGILGGIHKLYKRTGLEIKAGEKVPTQVLKWSGQILAEALAISGVNMAVTPLFEDGYHPTWEEFFQAMLMSSLSKVWRWRPAPKQEGFDFHQGGFKPSENVLNNKPIINAKGNAELMKDGMKFRDASGQEYFVSRVTGNTPSDVKITVQKVWETSGKQYSAKEFDALFAKAPTTVTSTPKVGVRVQDNPQEILQKIQQRWKLSKNESNFVWEMQNSIKNIDTMSVKELKALRVAVNDLGADKFMNWKIQSSSVTVKAWEKILTRIDEMIAIRSPKFSFPDLSSARRWIAEHPKLAISGSALAIAWSAYMINEKLELVKIPATESWAPRPQVAQLPDSGASVPRAAQLPGADSAESGVAQAATLPPEPGASVPRAAQLPGSSNSWGGSQ